MTCSSGMSGNVGTLHRWNVSFSLPMAELVNRKVYLSQAEANVFDHFQCFRNPKCRHLTLGYINCIVLELGELYKTSTETAAGRTEAGAP